MRNLLLFTAALFTVRMVRNGKGYSSVVHYLSSIHEALGSIPRTEDEGGRRQGKKRSREQPKSIRAIVRETESAIYLQSAINHS